MELILKYFPNLSARQREQFAALYQAYAEWNAKINVIPNLYGLAFEEQTVDEVQAEMGGIGGDDYKHHSGEQVAALCQLSQAIAGGKSGKGLDYKELKRAGQCYGASEKGNHVRYKGGTRV